MIAFVGFVLQQSSPIHTLHDAVISRRVLHETQESKGYGSRLSDSGSHSTPASVSGVRFEVVPWLSPRYDSWTC